MLIEQNLPYEGSSQVSTSGWPLVLLRGSSVYVHIAVNLILGILWRGDMNVQLGTMLLSAQLSTHKAIIQMMQKCSTLRLVTALCPTVPDTSVPQYLILCWCRV